MVKFLSAEEAVKLIKSVDTIATGGFVGTGVPEEIHQYVEKRFLSEGERNNLTLMYAAGQGDGQTKGLNHYAHEKLLKRVIGGHWGLAPALGKFANERKITGYNLPQGVISHMFRDIAAGKPGTLIHVGLGTFVDPDLQGEKINKETTDDIVRKMNIDGSDYLFYKAQNIDVVIVRGTSADENGNISMEKESLTL